MTPEGAYGRKPWCLKTKIRWTRSEALGGELAEPYPPRYRDGISAAEKHFLARERGRDQSVNRTQRLCAGAEPSSRRVEREVLKTGDRREVLRLHFDISERKTPNSSALAIDGAETAAQAIMTRPGWGILWVNLPLTRSRYSGGSGGQNPRILKSANIARPSNRELLGHNLNGPHLARGIYQIAARMEACIRRDTIAPCVQGTET